MTWKWLGLLIIGGLFIALLAAFYSLGIGLTPSLRSDSLALLSASPEMSSESASDPAILLPTTNYRLETVVENLFVPWSLMFTSSQRLLVTERSGAVRVIENGQLQSSPLFTFSEVVTGGEEGLMGMTLDPNYETNKYVYFSLAYNNGDDMAVKVVRLTDIGTALTDQVSIIEDIPAARNHAGSRVKFGPDGKLYITTGDASDRPIAQQMNSLGGKILRINGDGTLPADNPFPNSAIWSLGHRNPQGLDWHPVTGDLWSTEHGPSGFDGPGGGDEVNLIIKGANYGWPVVSHDKNREGLQAPKIVYTPAVAPASGMFYSGDVFPDFKNNFFFGALRGEGLYRVVLDENDPTKVSFHQIMKSINVGRVREVVQGPDGFIYFTTSNRDGQGDVQTGDDKVYRLVPSN